ncbi:unnamed protein product [Trichogramma brassicae]|uniref:Uncharacterized protein n=1 Tax=Trichogramma brassicae TaxID=86971 RepID=A0A6H5ICC1_9HYME|nr:unnamed protein product [Trichogramma brassicae]
MKENRFETRLDGEYAYKKYEIQLKSSLTFIPNVNRSRVCSGYRQPCYLPSIAYSWIFIKENRFETRLDGEYAYKKYEIQLTTSLIFVPNGSRCRQNSDPGFENVCLSSFSLFASFSLRSSSFLTKSRNQVCLSSLSAHNSLITKLYELCRNFYSILVNDVPKLPEKVFGLPLPDDEIHDCDVLEVVSDEGVGSIPTRRIFEVRFFAWCGRACARGGAGTTQKEDPGYVISLRSGKKPRSLYELKSDRITISRSPRRGLTRLAIDGAQHSHDEVRSENHTHRRAPDAGAKAQLERMMAPEARTTLTR